MSNTDLSKTPNYTSTFAVSIFTSFGQIPINNDDILECFFIEDIYSFSFTGKITFRDKYGIFEFGPITGNEIIKITYGEGANVQERMFNIYKLKNIEKGNDVKSSTQFICELLFCDISLMTMINKEFSYSWQNAKLSSIIKDILTDGLQINPDLIDIETCNEEYDNYYSPWWNARQNIMWLMERMSSTENKNAGYLCYSNTEDAYDGTLSFPKFHVKTLETLLQQNKLMTLNDEEGDQDTGLYFFEGSAATANHYNKILDWNLIGINHSAIKWLRGGTNMGYDIKTKSFLDKEYTYKDMLAKTTILGEASLFPDISETNISHNYTAEDNLDMMSNIFYNKWIKRYNLQNMLEITCRGHEGRYAGGMIEIMWPSISDKEIFNNNYGGGYLIKSITHYFRRKTPSYLQKMVLIKNGYENSQVPDLEKASKINLLNENTNMIKQLISGARGL